MKRETGELLLKFPRRICIVRICLPEYKEFPHQDVRLNFKINLTVIHENITEEEIKSDKKKTIFKTCRISRL